MAKHDVGVKRRKGTILGIKLSSEPGYDINDVMDGMIFDNDGNRIDEEAKKALCHRRRFEQHAC